MLALASRSLRYYWRTNLAIVAGVATAVAVLAGALLVGDSVRTSLRDIALARLGRVHTVASGAHFFREQLAAETGGCPVIVLQAAVTNADSRKRAGSVTVYGVDDRFWAFQGWEPESGVRISHGLEHEVGGGELIVRLEKPSAIPRESLHGRKDEGKTLRLSGAPAGHEFAIRPQQGELLTLFVPLRALQRALEQPGHVNTILYANGSPNLTAKVSLDDLGIRVRELPNGGLSVESDSAIVSDALAEAAGPGAHAVFSYLANTIRVDGREIPYSLVTAVDRALMPVEPGAIILNDWAATELSAKPGDSATLEYYVWGDGGNLLTRTATLRVQGVTPIRGLAADRNLTPEYPGITQARSIHDWDPPFPMNLGRIRPRDEAYWNNYRTTPKAFIAIETGQQMWASRFGRMTSLRLADGDAEKTKTAIRSKIDPARFGLTVYPLREASLAASRGSTDFGEYFTYFSFFLVASALLLAFLFFRLGIEQRFREIGTLRAVGWPLAAIRGQWLAESSIVAILGCLAGAAGAVAYCAFVLYGLQTWWRGAVGTTALRLHVNAGSLASGAAGGWIVALLVVWVSLYRLQGTSARRLLAGAGSAGAAKPAGRWVVWTALAAIAGALAMAGAGLARTISTSEAFFGAGGLLLAGALMLQSVWLRSARHGLDRSPTLWRLGMRNASFRPGRSLLCIALIASAVFLLVSLDSFRKSGEGAGTGGFPLMAESQLPVFWDPNSATGRENLNLAPFQDRLEGVRFSAFRLRPGEDASCLNLYEPREPRVLGARKSFRDQARFPFAESLARNDAEKKNPWLLLEGDAGGAVPAIADANSITYVLHKKVGDELLVGGKRVKLVAALQDSILQSELIVSEEQFVRLFPDVQGYRYFLIDAPSTSAGAVLEDALSDYGFDAVSTADRLAGYHQVENTYLSTFQALGALGLLLGTVGLAVVLLRNVLERRHEMALLGALGYRRDQLGFVVLAENAFLVACGMATGALCAALAVAPAAVERGTGAPFRALALLIVLVPLTALVSSLLAVRAVQRAPLLESLRAE